jgi:hypothetical protein
MNALGVLLSMFYVHLNTAMWSFVQVGNAIYRLNFFCSVPPLAYNSHVIVY